MVGPQLSDAYLASVSQAIYPPMNFLAQSWVILESNAPLVGFEHVWDKQQPRKLLADVQPNAEWGASDHSTQYRLPDPQPGAYGRPAR